jgi:hypothetical protein
MYYFNLVKTITPGRCPSVHYVEHKQIWGEFTYAPIYSVHTATFWKVHARLDRVDLRKEGRLDYWVRIRSTYCSASVTCTLNQEGEVTAIKYYFFSGLMVDSGLGREMTRVTAPDKELFSYCLAGFLQEHLSINYTFRFGRC